MSTRWKWNETIGDLLERPGRMVRVVWELGFVAHFDTLPIIQGDWTYVNTECVAFHVLHAPVP